MKEIKDALIELYLGIKIREITEINNITESLILEEKNNLNKLSIMEIINYLSISLEILSEIKAQEKYEKKLIEEEIKHKEKYYNSENQKDADGLKLYEGMLIKAESDIRNHIRVRNK